MEMEGVGGKFPSSFCHFLTLDLGPRWGGSEEAPLDRNISPGGKGPVCGGLLAPGCPHTTISLLGTPLWLRNLISTVLRLQTWTWNYFDSGKTSVYLDPQKDKLTQPLVLQVGNQAQRGDELA